MFALVITVHVITCALLILIVLIQQGRGGGLVDSLSSAESIFGTKTNAFLVKSTSVLAVIFFITCLSLAFLSVRKSKSLIETSYKPMTAPITVPMTTPITAPVTAPMTAPVTQTQDQAQPATAPPAVPQTPTPEPATPAQATAQAPASAPTTAPPSPQTPAAP